MGTQGTGRKRSTKKERSTAEDDALNLIAREAEARLAAKRAARAEAREIRMKELERQQKEIFQVQKKYYGLNTKVDDRMDSKWGDIEQWMEDSERYSRSSRIQTLSDEDERMSVGSRGSVRSDLDAVGAYGGGGSSLHKKSKKKKKHKHKDRDRNGYDDDYSVMSSRSSRLSDESRVSRSSRLDLTSSMLGDDSRVSRASRLDLQPASYASSDMYSLSSSRNPSSAFNGYQSSLYEDSLCSGSRRITGSSSHPLELTSYRSSSSRASSRASSARASPVDNCGSVASFLRSAAGSSALHRDLDDVTIPDFSDVEDRDYLEKGSRAASALTAGTLTSLGGTSSRRGSGETALTVDAESSIREIKEIHELKDQIQDVESKYTQNLKEAKDALAEVEEKYRKAMVSNAQLDNEKNNLMYQVDTLKDALMELEELLSESRREYEEKVKEYEREKHAHGVLQFQFNEMKETLKQSEELLNKHGIVLGPDLNINGDVGDSEVDGSPGADPASRPAQDTQTSPTEGNSMLGNTEETELRSSREEEVDPEQQQEMLQEVKENHLSSEIDSLNSTLCNVADVDTSSEKQLSEEQRANLPTEEDGIRQSGLSKDLTVDVHDGPTTEAKDVIVCSSEPQDIHPVRSPEENASETEISEGGDLKETRYSDLGETETKNNSVDTHSDIRDNKQESVEEKDQSNTEPCPQQKATQDVMKESVSDESVPALSNTEPEQGPENAEEADNIEAEETPSKSASGKKKRKKKKGKKKGGTQDNKNQQKDGTNKENKADKDEESAAGGSVTETVEESKVDQVKEQDKQETVEADAVEPTEPTETFTNSEAVKEPRTDHLSNENDEKQTLETKTLDDVEVVNLSVVNMDQLMDKQSEEQTLETETVESVEAMVHTESFSCVDTLKETRTDSKNNGQDEEQTLETETVESVEAVEPPAETLKETRTDSNNNGQDEEQTRQTETVESVEAVEPPAETLKENRTDSKNNEQEQEKTLETETVESVEAVEPPAETLTEFVTDSKKNERDDKIKSETENEEECETIPSLDPEASLCKSDLNSESTDGLGTKTVDDSESEVLCTKSEIVDQVEAEVESADETKPECTTKKPENSLETCSKESKEAESHISSNDDVAANESEFINSSESKENTSVSPPSTEDFSGDFKSLSESEPSAAMNFGNDDPTVKDSDQALEEATEAVVDDEDSGADIEEDCIHQDRTERVDLNGDLKEAGDLVQPNCSLHDEKSDKTPSSTNTTEALDSGKSLEAVVQNEQLDDAESKISECMDPVEESNAEEKTEEINTNATLDTPECPKEAAENGSDTEQETDVQEDSDLKDSQHAKESELSLDEQPHDSKDKCENDELSQPTQLLSDEDDDGEDDEGMSFDFDDMDMEAAVASELPENSEQEEVEEGVEVMLDETIGDSSGLCQSNTQSNENTQVKPVESNDEKCTVDNQVDALDQTSNTEPQETQNSLVNVEAASEVVENVCEDEENTPKEEAGVEDDQSHIAEEGTVLSVGGLGAVAESLKQTVYSLVEEGLDAVRSELQGEDSDLPKSTDQVESNKEAPQAGRDVKKSSKKGKGKGKEDCKMS